MSKIKNDAPAGQAQDAI